MGTICGICSAVGYTATNVCLKYVDDVDPVWVSCIKALPTVVCVAPFVLRRSRRGKAVFPDWKVFWIVLIVAVISQFGGNVAFQWALHVIGLALDVPITLGTMIVAGAVFGRVFLGDPLTPRMAISATILILATCILSAGASKVQHGESQEHEVSDKSTATTAPTPDIGNSVEPSPWKFLLGVLAAATAGIVYSGLSTVVRYGTQQRVDKMSLVGVICLVGVVVLGGFSLARHGPSIIFRPTMAQYQAMFMAGIFNYLAFISLAKALEVSTVFFVNALSTSQVLMAAIAGIVLFGEPATAELGLGVVLITIGLLSMKPRNQGTRKP